jgi:hypothetical protein
MALELMSNYLDHLSIIETCICNHLVIMRLVFLIVRDPEIDIFNHRGVIRIDL